MEIKELRAYVKSGEAYVDVTVGVLHLPPTLQVAVPGLDFESDYSESTLWDSLISLRKDLEDFGYILCCQGSRREVQPSGMQLDMGATRDAYVFKEGALELAQKNKVDILDPVPREQAATVAEQRETIRERWNTGHS
ncbi:hypothetical protein [Salininema proteolyticum]|uniref:Uncharacterized protein n=1 Tax=Salininema proteolyticum TaxID=1607685 RepID=A0ABV8TXW1_9ACTN